MNMNCKMVTDIAELYYDNSLSPETKKAIRSHLRGCRNCREYYRQYQAIRKQHSKPVLKLLPEDEIYETEKRLYTSLSEKLRRRRFWNIVGTSAAIGAGSVMLTIGLLLTHNQKDHTVE
ncbi:MAG: zf-HC2 domain-containing protein [Oscillospiraceae bacterium]|nr:zf-HC2 domain-containing protein [Oscillospiraceae bacterium]